MLSRPGAEPLTWRAVWSVVKRTASSWNDLNASHLGAALSFYCMFSLAPLLVIAVGIAGLVFGRQAVQGQIVLHIRNAVGPAGAKTIQTILAHVAGHTANIGAAVASFVVLLFGASGVFVELRDSLNAVWGITAPSSGIRGMVRDRFFAFALVLAIGFVLLVSVMLSAMVEAAGRYFAAFLPAPGFILQIGNLLISFAGVTVLFALLYKVVPDVPIEWWDVWVGAAVTSALFSVGKLLLGIYLGSATVASAYGAAASLVLFMIWIYYSAQIFFLGAEFTRIFSERHGSRAAHRAASDEIPRARLALKRLFSRRPEAA